MKLIKYFSIFVFIIGLASCFGDPEKELPILINDLSSKDSGVRNRACLRIGSFSSEAEIAVPYLIKLLNDPNNGVRTSAAFALRKIGSPKAQHALDFYVK